MKILPACGKINNKPQWCMLTQDETISTKNVINSCMGNAVPINRIFVKECVHLSFSEVDKRNASNIHKEIIIAAYKETCTEDGFAKKKTLIYLINNKIVLQQFYEKIL
jgi:hypothetical protein